MYSNFEQLDHRTIPYEILVTGDIYPSSKLRHNSMFNHSKLYESFGIIYESKSSKSKTKTEHELYDGLTSQTLKRDIKNTSEIRMWGVIRLVEATFDWHFNPVDFESLRLPSEIPSLKYFDYVMVAPPSILSGFTATITDGSLTGTLAGQLTTGDVVHKINEIGTNSSELDADLKVDGVTSGFALAYNGSNNLAYNSTLVDNYGALFGSTPANNILKFDGNIASNSVRINGVERFRLFSASDNSLDFISTTSDIEFYFDRTNGHRNINFHNSFLLHPPVNTGIFSHQLLRNHTASVQYDPMNVILPLMMENKSDGSNKRDMRFSPAHAIDGWDDEDATELTGDEGIVRLHMSRVVSAMVDNSFGASTPTITTSDKEALGIGRTHVYDNCIGLFRSVIETGDSQLSDWPTRTTLTSSPMGFSGYGSGTRMYRDSSGQFATYSNNHLSTVPPSAQDQHTPTTRV